MNYKEEVEKVYQRIGTYIRKTPVVSSDYYSHKLDTKIIYKCENLQHTNSFKVRGAFSKVTKIVDKKNKTLVACSGGNHGMAVAYAAREFGMHAIIIVPKFVPEFRINKIKALGAEVVVDGPSMDDSNAEAAEYAKDPNFIYVHPFDDDDVIAGQATVAHELLQQVPDVEVIVVSIGGGGLISGIAQYVKAVNSNILVYGVQTIGADAMCKSLEAGKLVSIPSVTSIAISLGATKVAQRTFEVVQQDVAKVVAVSDDEALHELRGILDWDKLLVEPASSCSLAAIVTEKLPKMKGKKVAVILCGGNFSLEQLKSYLP